MKNSTFYVLAFLLCIPLFGCNTTRTEWVHKGDWVYYNNSSYTLELKGAITSFTVSNPPLENFTLKPGENYTVVFRSDGEKSIPPEVILNPFDPSSDVQDHVAQIVVDGTRTITLEEGSGIRDRNNYTVEKLTDRHYRFTYTFTDEIIEALIL